MDLFEKMFRSHKKRTVETSLNQRDMPISEESLELSVELNMDKVKRTFGNSHDIITQTIHLKGDVAIRIGCIYINGLMQARPR
ncbi:hypothetical protein D3C85_1060030 [compost metagenome]